LHIHETQHHATLVGQQLTKEHEMKSYVTELKHLIVTLIDKVNVH